jgi:hypothetical protein
LFKDDSVLAVEIICQSSRPCKYSLRQPTARSESGPGKAADVENPRFSAALV